MPMPQVKITALKLLFPMDRCRELIKLALDADEAKLLAEDTVFVPALSPEDMKKLNDPKTPKAARELIKLIEPFAGKKVSELPQPTAEQAAEFLEDEVLTATDCIVTSWLNVLYEAQVESLDKPVRLDSSLLPPPELAQYDGVGWDEWLTSSLMLTVEQIRELMALYAAKIMPIFDLMIANNPNGFNLTENLFIRKDAGGFYLSPKIKD